MHILKLTGFEDYRRNSELWKMLTECVVQLQSGYRMSTVQQPEWTMRNSKFFPYFWILRWKLHRKHVFRAQNGLENLNPILTPQNRIFTFWLFVFSKKSYVCFRNLVDFRNFKNMHILKLTGFEDYRRNSELWKIAHKVRSAVAIWLQNVNCVATWRNTANSNFFPYFWILRWKLPRKHVFRVPKRPRKSQSNFNPSKSNFHFLTFRVFKKIILGFRNLVDFRNFKNMHILKLTGFEDYRRNSELWKIANRVRSAVAIWLQNVNCAATWRNNANSKFFPYFWILRWKLPRKHVFRAQNGLENLNPIFTPQNRIFTFWLFVFSKKSFWVFEIWWIFEISKTCTY